MSLRRVRFLPLPLIIGMVVAGCGSSSSSSTTSASKPSVSSSTSTSASPSEASSAGTTPIAITTKHTKLGTIVAAGTKDLTVYLFEADKGSSSACSGECTKLWPPVTGKGLAKDKANASDLGTITRADGTTQVTYKGHPLYYFIKDKDDGDAYGQGSTAFGAGWYVLSPAGNKIDES